MDLPPVRDGHEEHADLLPRPRDREDSDHLDELLARVHAHGVHPQATARLISEHVSRLAAGIAPPPRPGARALVDPSPVGVVRWLQLALDDEIDTLLVRFATAPTVCPECNRRWMLHLLTARARIRQWAWHRETDLLTH